MVSFRALVPAAAALLAVASAHKYHPKTTMPPTTTVAPKYGKYGYVAPVATTMPPTYKYPAPEPKCEGKTPAGERCAGAPGKPYIPWLGCCEGYACMEDKEMGWGSFCKPVYKPEPKCYAEGERCIGAPGKPYVEYMECCGDDMWCAKDETMGWGSFCKKMPKGYGYMMPTTAPPSKYYDYPTAAPTPAPKNYYKYGYPTAMPMTTPPEIYDKSYGYSEETAVVDSAGYYAGYYYGAGKAGTKADDPFAAFGKTFGCPATPVAAVDPVFPAPQPFQMTIVLTIESCSATVATFGDADANALLNSLCASFTAIDSAVECRISDVAGTVARMLEMPTADRQLTPAPTTTTTTTTTTGGAAGVSVSFQFQAPLENAPAIVAAASAIVGPVGGSVSIETISVTTAAPTTTGTVVPVETAEP